MTNAAPRTERPLLRIAAAAALGALHAESYSPPLGGPWWQLIALAGLLALARPRVPRLRSTMLVAIAFGLGWFVCGVGWLHTSMHVYGGMPSALAAAAVVLFALYLSLFPTAALWAAVRWGPAPAGVIRDGIAIAAALGATWCASELLRGWLFSGFPWLSVGYAHVDGPLAGFAPWVGVYGVGALAAASASLLASAAQALLGHGRPLERWRAAIALLVLALAPMATGTALEHLAWTQPAGAPVTVRLLQGNVPQQLKFDRARALEAMEDYTRLVESSRARLVVLPETAWTVPWGATPPEIAARIMSHARKTGAAIAIGMPLPEAAPRSQAMARWTNSVALLEPPADGGPEPSSLRARYDKRHLVPFGEFVPYGFAWFVELMRIPLGEFGRGAARQPPFEVAGQRFAFNVCYEDLFGEELLEAVREPLGATVLVNVSNIAWFGDSRALPQHLGIARMRTLETGRPMLRATNTGVTAAIDHRGRVIAALPAYRHGALDVSVQGTTGLTPYARFGNAAAAALALALLALAWLAGGGRAARKR